ncbi:lycopene cyclase domain-containing protein [Curtobacterium sp. Leaf261]|uniref:lycopene cyclase domain-containing protein n=1 Tax=Curtobacterium sp. Leaf261 TaxID=1736311 RepID=UPI0006F83AA1|nr:lycopene cyclase domain-containing protein [Curtobacterium sp. Leaf261]KQO61353.1 C50 carotenoid epsilon cyclase [Curtobacterium sp. Leaf261]
MPGLYLLGLVVALVGMTVLDRRFGLFFWRAPVRAAVVMVVGIVFFLVWDLTGIGLGVFFVGDTVLLTGVMVAPEVPVEELFFLALLCYVTMDLVGFVAPRVRARADRSGIDARRVDGARG